MTVGNSEKRGAGVLLGLLVILLHGLCLPCLDADDTDDADALKLFEGRIMPIFRSEKPSSCVQCHLSSVDIKNYILPSHRDTFLALKRDGLIDLNVPEKSKILRLIQMGDEDLDQGARLIHERTRKAEYKAFSSWIRACCRDPGLCQMSASAEVGTVGPEKPLEIVRHARKSRVLESFTRNIWTQRMRCFPCHTPHELDGRNPKHQTPIQRHQDFVKKFGSKMNIFQKTPEATLAKLIVSSRSRAPDRYPLINIDDPEKSLLILKPTSKVPPRQDDGTLAPPSSFDPVSHLGGLKMHVNDQSYKSFMVWLKDYSATAAGEYVSVEELPTDHWIPTQRVIRLRDIPKSWGDRSVVQVFVHSHSDGDPVWSPDPVAFSQGTITPRRMMNGTLSLIPSRSTADSDTDGSEVLSPGRFLIRAFVDSKNRLAEDPTILLEESDFIGQTVIDAQWQVGFPRAESVSANVLKK